jgi:hypothetical protein
VRGLRLPLLAIVGGIALVVGGGYLTFRDSGESTPKVDVSVPHVTVGPLVISGCDDSRLTDRRELAFKAYDSKGDVRARVSCLSGLATLSFDGRLPADVDEFDVWLYNNRDDAKEVGEVISLDGLAVGTVTLDDSSSGYISIVLTDAKRRKPVPIGLQARL